MLSETKIIAVILDPKNKFKDKIVKLLQFFKLEPDAIICLPQDSLYQVLKDTEQALMLTFGAGPKSYAEEVCRNQHLRYHLVALPEVSKLQKKKENTVHRGRVKDILGKLSGTVENLVCNEKLSINLGFLNTKEEVVSKFQFTTSGQTVLVAEEGDADILITPQELAILYLIKKTFEVENVQIERRQAK